jgi:hypothetical protein
MRLPLTPQSVSSLGSGLFSATRRPRRRADSVTRTAVLPGQSPLWRPPSRLTGLLERYDRMTPALA